MVIVIGKGHCGELLTIVERQTGFTVLTRLDEKPTKTVTAATIALSASFKYPVLTITADNGENIKKSAASDRVLKQTQLLGVLFFII
jgi:IS30 family transposase